MTSVLIEQGLSTRIRKYVGHAILAMPLLAAPLLGGCASTTPTERGAMGGAAVGAGLGAIIGNQSGNAGTGALIGGALGAAGGAVTGSEVEKHRREREYSPPPRSQHYPVRGHYENRLVRGSNGESYEERVWVPDAR